MLFRSPRRASRRRPPLRQPRLRRQRRLLTALPATVFGPCRSLSKKVPSSRHVRMDGTHTGKWSAESVRGRNAECAVQRSILSKRGSRAERVQWTKQRRRGWRSAPVFASAHRGAPQKSAKRKRGQGGRISDLRSRQKWVPPGAWRFCDTLTCVLFGIQGLFVCLS